jgi:hypothetical protein
LISIEDCGRERLMDDLGGVSKKSIDAVLMLAAESNKAMTKPGLMT